MSKKAATPRVRVMKAYPIKKAGGRSAYPFAELKRGSCFIVTGTEKEKYLRMRASSLGSKLGKRFRVNIEDGNIVVTRTK